MERLHRLLRRGVLVVSVNLETEIERKTLINTMSNNDCFEILLQIDVRGLKACKRRFYCVEDSLARQARLVDVFGLVT